MDTPVGAEHFEGFGPGEGQQGDVAVGFVDGEEGDGGVVAGDVVLDLADGDFEGVVLGCGGGWRG